MYVCVCVCMCVCVCVCTLKDVGRMDIDGVYFISLFLCVSSV